MSSVHHSALGDGRRMLAFASACAVCIGLLGCSRSESLRRPLPGERIVAETASGNKWVAGKINDIHVRYRFAEAKNGSTFFDALLLPSETLPRIRIDFVCGDGKTVTEGEIAWAKRFC